MNFVIVFLKNTKGGEEMEQQQLENTLTILQYHETISNIIDEFRNRIPEKHLNQFEDLLLELDFISNKFSALEKNLFLQYLDNQISEKE